MKPNRLEALSDGIFAIIMTLLVIEIKVPELHLEKLGNIEANRELSARILELSPLFISFIISFVILYIYWRAHHFVLNFAKNITVPLSDLNALFFLFIAIFPFSAHLLGTYHDYQTAIIFYGSNIIVIGLSLFFMFNLILSSKKIENVEMTSKLIRNIKIRLLLPIFSSLLAILVSFTSTKFSITIFAISGFFSFIPGWINLLDRILGID